MLMERSSPLSTPGKRLLSLCLVCLVQRSVTGGAPPAAVARLTDDPAERWQFPEGERKIRLTLLLLPLSTRATSRAPVLSVERGSVIAVEPLISPDLPDQSVTLEFAGVLVPDTFI